MDFSSDTLLLSTKLKIPVPRKNYVVRGALFERLSQCADMSVIFVRGGAGTGKTTLLSSFIRERKLKNVCWLSLDTSNANVYSFWLYFTAAVSAFWDDGESLLTMIRSSPDPSHIESLLIMLINRLCGEDDYYMVLDDVHCVSDPAFIRSFEFFIGAMPTNFHIFMLSREDPPVYLGPLAVSGRLEFIDGDQMQLSHEEGMAFLKNTLALKDGEEELLALSTYAEGWIGGLQLAVAAKATVRGSERLLGAGVGIAAEYLTREVLEALEQEERDFLIKTGFLSYFDAEICADLFEGFFKTDFENMVASLVQKNLFIICIDELNGVYRYHNILSEYLTQRFRQLPEEQRNGLYMKAAAACENRGDYEEALRQYYAAGSFGEILRVAKAMEGRIEAWSYLDKVPDNLLIQNIDLATQCFIYNIGSLNIDRCRALYEKFRECYGDSDAFTIMQFAEPYITSQEGRLPRYRAVNAEQIENLNLGPAIKAMAMVQNSAAFMEQARYEEAESCIKKAVAISGGINVFVEFFAYNQLAQVYEEIGSLNDSLLAYNKAEELLRSPSMLAAAGANFNFGIAGVFMRRMELDKAAKALEYVEQLIESHHIHINITDMTLKYHLAEMKFLTGDERAGAAYIDDILTEYSNFSVLTLGRLIHELDCAEILPTDLSDAFLKEIEVAEEYRAQPFMRLLCARLLFKRGEIDAAFSETEEILTFSRMHKNRLRLVEAGLLKVLMLTSRGKTAAIQREISNLLREAVHYAYADRLLMPFFLDRSLLLPLMKDLLTQAAGKNILSSAEVDFLRNAIAVCGGTDGIAKEPDALSSRELEVLNEIALGITNREIADKLCISQATVKTHVLNIFGKLGVSSRMSAVDVGRKKGLVK